MRLFRSTRITRHRALAGAVLMLCGLAVQLPVSGADAARLSGHWTLDEDRSEDAEDAFDGKLRKRRFDSSLPSGSSSPGQRRTVADKSQEEYWRTVAENEERRASSNLNRLGTVYPLITAAELDISPSGSGLDIVYDGLLPRYVRPNPGGRVFSASGDELVADTIGYTLAYWDGDDLMLETDPPDGGKYIERLRLSDGGKRIEYRVKVRSRVLEEPVEMVREFVRAGEARARLEPAP
jgi:hypothetical protein